MNPQSYTKCQNTRLIADAIRLADKMLAMAQNGVPKCEDDRCMVVYGIIRDCGYKIRKTVEQEQFTDFAGA